MSPTPRIIAAVPAQDGDTVARDESGTWRYEGTSIPAVAPRDISLADVARPRFVGREGEEPEGVLVGLSEIRRDRRLGWIVHDGTQLDGGDEPLFFVPLAVWQEQSAMPVDVWLPERDGTGLARSLAVAERDVRFAKHALDEAQRRRTRAVVLATALGLSRREIADAIDLSAGRIQQLHDGASDEDRRHVDALLRAAKRVAAALADKPLARGELVLRSKMGADHLDEVLDDLEALGVVTVEDATVTLSPLGARLIAGGSGRAKKARGSDAR